MQPRCCFRRIRRNHGPPLHISLAWPMRGIFIESASMARSPTPLTIASRAAACRGAPLGPNTLIPTTKRPALPAEQTFETNASSGEVLKWTLRKWCAKALHRNAWTEPRHGSQSSRSYVSLTIAMCGDGDLLGSARGARFLPSGLLTSIHCVATELNECSVLNFFHGSFNFYPAIRPSAALPVQRGAFLLNSAARALFVPASRFYAFWFAFAKTRPASSLVSCPVLFMAGKGAESDARCGRRRRAEANRGRRDSCQAPVCQPSSSHSHGQPLCICLALYW